MEKPNLTYHRLSLSDPASPIVRCSLEDHIKHSLRACLLTVVGERPLYPEAGATLREWVFRNFVSQVKNEISHCIRTAIESHEPRVELTMIELESDPHGQANLLIKLKYRIRETQRMDGTTIAL